MIGTQTRRIETRLARLEGLRRALPADWPRLADWRLHHTETAFALRYPMCGTRRSAIAETLADFGERLELDA